MTLDASTSDHDLNGRHILLIEDEHIVAAALARALNVCGAVIVGPAATVDQALALLRSTPRVDGAMLDINLRGIQAFPVADDLMARGVPFVFATGYSAPIIPPRYRNVPVLQKPFDPDKIASALFPTSGLADR